MKFLNKEIAIVDIDSTIANIGHRIHHISGPERDWDAFHAAAANDEPIGATVAVVNILAMKLPIFIVTARHEYLRSATEEWLLRHGIAFDRLFMRADGDYRHDDIAKSEIFDQIVAEGFNPLLAIEDRKRVAEMYRDKGILVLHVAEGNY